MPSGSSPASFTAARTSAIPDWEMKLLLPNRLKSMESACYKSTWAFHAQMRAICALHSVTASPLAHQVKDIARLRGKVWKLTTCIMLHSMHSHLHWQMNFGPITLTTKYIYIGYRSFFKENPAVGHYNRQTYMSWHHLNPKATHVFWRWDHMCEWPSVYCMTWWPKLIQNSNLCQKRSVWTYAVTTIGVHVVREILWWMESTYLLLQGLAPIPKQGSANMTGKGFWKILVLT